MQTAKNTQRACVGMRGDGCYVKKFRHHSADERFRNEIRVLLHLEHTGCPFVPRLVDYSAADLTIVTSNCGLVVERLPEKKVDQLFGQLLKFGVRHGDPALRNITYNAKQGRFCVIDFEFAEILDSQVGETTVSESASVAPDTAGSRRDSVEASVERQLAELESLVSSEQSEAP